MIDMLADLFIARGTPGYIQFNKWAEVRGGGCERLGKRRAWTAPRLPRTGSIRSGCDGEGLRFDIIARSCLGGRYVSDRFEQSAVSKPFEPLQRGEL